MKTEMWAVLNPEREIVKASVRESREESIAAALDYYRLYLGKAASRLGWDIFEAMGAECVMVTVTWIEDKEVNQ